MGAGGTFTYQSPSKVLTITASVTVQVGVCLGGSVQLGVTRDGGAITFAGQVAVTAVVGGSIDLKVTIDAGKLKAHVNKQVKKQVVKIQKELEKRKKEEDKRLLEPGTVKSDSPVDCTVDYQAEEVDVLALAAAAKALN